MLPTFVDKYRWPIVIAVVVLAVFGQSVMYPLTMPDDGLLMVLNPAVHSPSLHGFAAAWKPQIGLLYIPLTTNFWSLLALVFGTNAADPPELHAYVYHGANVLLQLISALVVYKILRIVFRNRWASAAGAIIWAIHPLQAECVAWAAGMKDILSGLLALLAVLCYVNVARREGSDAESPTKLWGWLIAAGLLMGAANFAKPGGAATPLAAIAIAWLLLGKSMRKSILWSLPMFMAIVPSIVLTSQVQAVGRADFVTPLWTRPFIAGHALAVYVQHTIFPYPLTMDYGLTPKHVMAGADAYLAWLVPAAITVVAFVVYRRGHRLLAAWIVFVAGVLPTLGLVPFGHQFRSTVTDRYAHLALLGAAILVAAHLERHRKTTADYVAAGACVMFAIGCFLQVRIWRDCQSFGSHLVWVNPTTSIGYHELAVGKMDDAVQLSRKGKRQTDPAEQAEYFRLSDSANAQAEQYLHDAIEREPGNLAALQDLVKVYRREGKRDEAYATLERAMEVIESLPPEMQPESEDRLRAAEVFMRRGEYARAMGHVQKFLQRHPEHERANQLRQEITRRAATQPATRGTTLPAAM